MGSSVFAEPQMVVLAWRLYSALDAACFAASDLPLPAYALLVSSSEREEGLTLKEARAQFDEPFGLECLARMLERPELVERVRNPRNRREFSLRATRKGLMRIDCVDEMLALRVLSFAGTLDEGLFEQMVDRMTSLSLSEDGASRVATMFPGTALRMFSAYRAIAAEESARVGLTSLQTALLCALDVGIDIGAIPGCEGISDDAVERQLGELREKGFICDTGQALSEEGIERTDAFCRSVRSCVDDSASRYGERTMACARELCELALYALT